MDNTWIIMDNIRVLVHSQSIIIVSKLGSETSTIVKQKQ